MDSEKIKLKSVKDAVRFLTAKGWRASGKSIYRHSRENSITGKIEVQRGCEMKKGENLQFKAAKDATRYLSAKKNMLQTKAAKSATVAGFETKR